MMGYGEGGAGSLLDSLFMLIIFSLAKLFYRPARLKLIQINKTPGSIHWLPIFPHYLTPLYITNQSKRIVC